MCLLGNQRNARFRGAGAVIRRSGALWKNPQHIPLFDHSNGIFHRSFIRRAAFDRKGIKTGQKIGCGRVVEKLLLRHEIHHARFAACDDERI